MVDERNGRGPDGRFVLGNPGGPGNPHGKRTAEIRSALLNAVTDDDVQQIAAKVVERAKSGCLESATWLFDRLIGKPVAALAIQAQIGESSGVSDAELQEKARRYGLAGGRLRAMIDGPAQIAESNDWYGSPLPDHETIRALRQEMLNEPEYLDYLRHKAMEADRTIRPSDS